EPGSEPATPPPIAPARRSGVRDSKSDRPVPVGRAYTRMPSGSRKGPAKSEAFLAAARAGAGTRVAAEEIPPGTATRHFIAGDSAPDMELAFGEIHRCIA